MADICINMHSDTQSRPTQEMRNAMMSAELGDEQLMEDPTTNLLCATVAELLGKESAVLLPSGTMCNIIAIAVHCRTGDEILCDRTTHIINSEAGACTIFGALPRPLDGRHGIYTAAQLEAAIRPESRYSPTSRLVEVEQTSVGGGGTVWPLERLYEIADVARKNHLLLHMDGARLFNAVVATDIPAKDHAASFDSVWIDLSKGLGCPIGAVLAGSAEFIGEAWRWKQRLGGAMRQSGIIAAAGLYALDNHVDRMEEDHANARLFAERVANLPGILVDLETVQTNIIYMDVSPSGLSAHAMQTALAARGVRISAVSKTRLRALTHLDVSTPDVEEAAVAVRAVLEATTMDGSKPEEA